MASAAAYFRPAAAADDIPRPFGMAGGRTHGLPPVEVGGEGRVLDPRPSEPGVEPAERPGVRPAGVQGRARPRRGGGLERHTDVRFETVALDDVLAATAVVRSKASSAGPRRPPLHHRGPESPWQTRRPPPREPGPDAASVQGYRPDSGRNTRQGPRILSLAGSNCSTNSDRGGVSGGERRVEFADADPWTEDERRRGRPARRAECGRR